jgi:hypothetical protein
MNFSNNNKNNNLRTITYNDLPWAIEQVLYRLEQIEKVLNNHSPEIVLKTPITTIELCKFLDVSEPTIARYRKKGLIPFFTIGSAIRYDLNKVIASLENKKKAK